MRSIADAVMKARFLAMLVTAALAVSAASGPARAQRLNLDSGGAPAAGSGAAALALADALDKQIDGLKRQAGAGPSALVSIALRQAARDLLRAGEQAGEAGSVRVLAGRTLADHLATLDAVVADRARLDAMTLEGVARDLDRPIGSLPRDGAEIDRWLRDALAPVTQIAGPAVTPVGWFVAGAKDVKDRPEALVRWAAGLQITDPTREAITKLDERLRAAEAWVAYGPTAKRISELVREAAGPLESKPAWMTASLRHDLEEALVAAIAPLVEPGVAGREGADPAALLRRLATVAGLLARAEEMDESSTAARELRTALQGLLKADAVTASEDRRLAGLERALELVSQRRELEKDAGLARQLKPALRGLLPAARESETAVLVAMKRLTQDDGALSDPAVLNAVSAHQRRLADLRLIVDVNRAIAVPGMTVPGEKATPGVAPEFKGLADWIFEIGQDLGKPGRRDVAIAELREVAGGAVESIGSGLGAGPVRRLRAAIDPTAPREAGVDLSAWNELTGDKTARLLDAADKARAALIVAWNAKDVPRRQAAEQQARALNRVLALVDDAVGLRTLQRVQQSGAASGSIANLQQWPGWEVSAGTLDAMSDGLVARLRAAVDRILAGDGRGAEEAARSLQAEFAAAMLAGRLEGLATRAGQRVERVGPAATLHELGLGAADPDRSWMAARRGEIAAVCRYAEEWALAKRDAKDKARAAAVAAYMNQAAGRLLEQVGGGDGQ